MENENNTVTTEENENNGVSIADNEYLIKFNKPYTFESQNYDSVNLSNIENLSTSDLIAADKVYLGSGNMSPTSEMTLAYACIIAAKVTQKPIEFFNQLPAKEGMKVKTAVVNFLYN